MPKTCSSRRLISPSLCFRKGASPRNAAELSCYATKRLEIQMIIGSCFIFGFVTFSNRHLGKKGVDHLRTGVIAEDRQATKRCRICVVAESISRI